jgi:hypothetical protein
LFASIIGLDAAPCIVELAFVLLPLCFKTPNTSYLIKYSYVITIYSGYVNDVLCVIAAVMVTRNDFGYD